MKTIETVKKVLADTGVSIIEDAEHADLVFGISATNGRYVCEVTVFERSNDEHGDIIVFDSFIPQRVPVKKMDDVMRFLNVLNFSLIFGAFYIDLFGIVHCKTSIPITRDKVDATAIDNLIGANATIIDGKVSMIKNVARGLLPSHDSGDDIFAGVTGEIPVV